MKTRYTIYCSNDATCSKQMGRMVNDGIGIDQNATMKLLYVGDEPHLVTFATKDICPGEEVKYDYGIKNLPWRKLKGKEKRKGNIGM